MTVTIYRGHIDAAGRALIDVVRDGAPIGYALPHQVRHSPTGFQWGYGGSGPADTARSILADHLGCLPHPAVYQQFKIDRIAGLARSWSMTSDDIEHALAAIAAALRVTCLRCVDVGIIDADNQRGRVTCSCSTGRTLAANDADG